VAGRVLRARFLREALIHIKVTGLVDPTNWALAGVVSDADISASSSILAWVCASGSTVVNVSAARCASSGRVTRVTGLALTCEGAISVLADGVAATVILASYTLILVIITVLADPAIVTLALEEVNTLVLAESVGFAPPSVTIDAVINVNA
jgi:hypothetical protein